MNSKVVEQFKEDLSSYSTEAIEKELATRKAKKGLPFSFKVKFPLGKYIESQDIYNEVAAAMSKITPTNFKLNQEVVDFIDRVVDKSPDLYDWEVSFTVYTSLGGVGQFTIDRKK